MSVVHVTNENELDNILKSNNCLCVIYFTASWCGPCKMISPYFSDLAQTTHNCLFIKVDVDECESLTKLWNVESMPTFIFVKNKNILQTLKGANKEKLSELLKFCL